MRTEPRGVPGATHVADDQFLVRETQMQLGLEPSKVHVAFRESVSEKHDPLPCRRDGHALRPGGRRRGRFGVGRMGMIVGGTVRGGCGTEKGNEESEHGAEAPSGSRGTKFHAATLRGSPPHRKTRNRGYFWI